jgi:hypothetical protein
LPISLCLGLVLLALGALLGCASRGSAPEHRPRPPSPAASRASASPTVEPPVSAAAPLLGDAEAVLRARLANAPPEQGLELFFQTFRAGELSCDSEKFSAIRSAGSSFTRSSEGLLPCVLSGGSFESTAAPGSRAALHGLSSVSLLIDGSEWFFSRSECLKHPWRSPPANVASEPHGVDIGGLVDRQQEVSLWYHGGKPVSVSGHFHAWFDLGDASYHARFYSQSNVAWLEGPLNRPAKSESERRGGLYAVRENESGFEVGSDRFCRQLKDCPCAAEAPNPAILVAAPRDDISDFARQFRDYYAPLFVPLRDSTGTVCKELRLGDYEQVTFSAFGRRQDYRIAPRISGFNFGRSFGLGIWLWARMTVHARDEQSFWLNGSPWYLELEDCEAAKAWAKPANFRAAGIARLTDSADEPRLRIVDEYFALENEPNGAACRKVTFDPLLAGGRLRIETAAGVVERDYDFYADEWGFWFGPLLTPELPADQRYRGTFVVPQRMRGGILMDGVPWFESSANCKAALARRPRPKKSSTSAGKLTVHAD